MYSLSFPKDQIFYPTVGGRRGIDVSHAHPCHRDATATAYIDRQAILAIRVDLLHGIEFEKFIALFPGKSVPYISQPPGSMTLAVPTEAMTGPYLAFDVDRDTSPARTAMMRSPLGIQHRSEGIFDMLKVDFFSLSAIIDE